MTGMKTNVAPTLARPGAVVVALCLVFAGVLATPASAGQHVVDDSNDTSATQLAAIAGASVTDALTVLATADRRPLRLAQSERPRVSLDQAVAKVRSRYKGRVIRAETRYSQDGRPTHYVKLLSPDGHVRTIRVDGRTGRIR